MPRYAEKRGGAMPNTTRNCSFCGKSSAEVKKLISGPCRVYICDECVCRSADILGEMQPAGRRVELDGLTVKQFLESFGRPPDSMTVGEMFDVYEAQSLIIRTRARKPAKTVAVLKPPIAAPPDELSEAELTSFLSRQYCVPAIDLDSFEIDPVVAALVPKEICIKHKLIPVNRVGSSLIIAMVDPSNIYAIDDVKFVTNHNVEVVFASERAIMAAIEKHYTPPPT